MTMLELIFDPELVEELTPPCDWLVDKSHFDFEPCPEAAGWVVTFGCGQPWLACDQHADFARRSDVVVCPHGPCSVRSVVKL